MSDEAEVLEAAAALMAAFAGHDRVRYFESFAPDATFLFHTAEQLIGSREEYEALWRTWEARGFRVLGSQNSDQRVDVVAPGVAVFTHRVRTRLAGADTELSERETIVFVRDGAGRWLGVHEHLSPDPAPAAP